MTARAYCGCMSPVAPLEPREPATVAGELADAADRLELLVHRIFAAGEGTGEPETVELDALAVGISRAACELRARHRVQGGGNA